MNTATGRADEWITVSVFHILRTNLAAVIQSSSRGASSGRGVRALSGVLVVAQVAVA